MRRREFITLVGGAIAWTNPPWCELHKAQYVQIPCCLLSKVHPRACGERGARSFHASHAAGSSPRVRGTLDRADESARASRFIPARAGNAMPLSRERQEPEKAGRSANSR
jgi:hypothetical protein